MLRNTLFLASCLLLISACSSSSHLIVGEVRAPIPPERVSVYLEKPQEFEIIAVVSSSSAGSFSYTEQAKMDTALQLLKEEAAKLGANGVLLNDVGDQEVLVPITNPNGTVTYATGVNKTLKAKAIFVLSNKP